MNEADSGRESAEFGVNEGACVARGNMAEFGGGVCGEGGMNEGGVGNDSSMRGTGARLPVRCCGLVDTGIAMDDGGERERMG